MSDVLPAVTVIMPVLNEEETIDACLESLAVQDYVGQLDVVVAEGGSTDGTAARLTEWQERLPLTIVPNPDRLQGPGLNRAAAAAGGEVLVRADAHTEYAADYVRSSVAALLDSGAAAVGGPMRPSGVGRFGRAVARAMSSPLTTGPGRFHSASAAGPVDTVYLGTFRRDDFIAIGGFRSFPSGSGEDADLFHRWRRQGRTVVLDPAIRSTYRPRETARSLARQHLRYGQAKAELLYANGRWPSWRPAAPLLLVLALPVAVVVSLATPWWWAAPAVAGAWLVVMTVAALRAGRLAPLVVVAAAIMHVTYGLGLLWGFLRGRGFRRRLAPAHGGWVHEPR